MLHSLRFILLVGAASLALVPWVTAAPGDLDGNFGTLGALTTPIGGTNEGRAVAIQSDGRIVVVGDTTPAAGGGSDFAVVRYNPDGTLDTNFNSASSLPGIVTTDLGGDDHGTSVALQSDGKIVVAGYTDVGGEAFALVRYNTDGTLDTGFGSGGIVTTTFANGARAFSVVVQSDGMIVAVGSAHDGAGNLDLAVVRYTSTGALDSGFGSLGVITTSLNLSFDDTLGAVLQADGSIVVGAQSLNGGSGVYNFAVVRYTTSGALDSGFGTGGIVTTPIVPTSDATGRCVALQSDGKIVVAGRDGASSGLGAVVRYNVDGSLDTGFGSSGITGFSPGVIGDSDLRGVAVTGTGTDTKIVVVGFGHNGTNENDILVARLLADGNMDRTFGHGGSIVTAVDANDDRANGLAVQGDGRIVVVGSSFDPQNGNAAKIALLRYFGGDGSLPLAPPVQDTTTMRPDGATFLSFNSPAVDGGIVGGAALVLANGKKQTFIYGGANSAALAQTGRKDLEGATFTALGDPVFAGEALGFAAVAELPPPPPSVLLRMPLDLRAFTVTPGGRLAALYSQLSQAAGIHRLAAQTDPAPGGGQFARFHSFGLPRQRLGLLYAALLHHDGQGVTTANDSGIWRERSDASGTDLLLRTGQRGFGRTARGGGVAGRALAKITFMPPVPNATDQRLSHAPDGGVAVLAKFDDGSSGVVAVMADGTKTVPIEQASPVPDEAGTADGQVQFVRFAPPATASSGRLALLAALKAAASGQPAPRQAIFANTGGVMHRLLTRGDLLPGSADTRFGQLGQPLLGEKGMIGLIAALTGKGVTSATNKVVLRLEGGQKTVVARLGDQVSGLDQGIVYRKFQSIVVTDSDPARVLFAGTMRGPGINASNSSGLWSYSATTGVDLVLRSGRTIMAAGQSLTVRAFDALQAPKKSQGQGRSTDASGFVTAKARLSDGRVGVLRIPLP